MNATKIKTARKLLTPVLLLGFLTSVALPAQQPPDKAPDQLRTLSPDELGVIKVLTMQERAWNNGDLTAYATGYKNSPDILFVGRQVSSGYDSMLADYRHNYPNKEAMGVLSFGDLEPHILDEHYAIVLGKYHLSRSKKGGGDADGIFSLVLEKTAAGWKIILDHTT
jgi:ketosteroid isomerase-like protein